MRLAPLIVMLSFSAMCSPSVAQPSPEEVRQMLGGVTDMEQAVLLAASRVSLRQLCDTTAEHEAHAAIIGRLQYGSIEPEQREAFKNAMQGQILSNQTIYQSFSDPNKAAFCRGLQRTVTSIAASFVTAHPSLFTQINVPKEVVSKPSLEEQVTNLISVYAPAYRLYIFKMAENKAFEDFELISRNYTKASDVTWALKVFSIELLLLSQVMEPEFPSVAALYKDHSNIVARAIRGEINSSVMETLEKENASKLKAAYDQKLLALKTSTPKLVEGAREAQQAADKIALILIGSAKYLSVAK